MLPLDAPAFDRIRFAIWGIGWLLAVSGWVGISLWVVADARSVFGRAMPWKLLFTVVGTAIFLGTFAFGLAALPYLLFVLPVLLATSYFVARDKASPRSLQWLPWQRVAPLEERLIARLGLTNWLTHRRLVTEAATRRATAFKTLLLVRHDGTPCDERDPLLDKSHRQIVGPLKRLLWRASDSGATAISLEPPLPADAQPALRCRAAGAAEPLLLPKPLTAGDTAVVLKDLAGIDATRTSSPRQGRFQLVSGDHRIEINTSVGPGSTGEKIVMRPFEATALPTFGRLGMPASMAQKVREILTGSQGVLIVAGPAGSGKTTTVFSLLKSIDPLTNMIVTIEDRPQYVLDNVVQTTVDSTPDGTVSKRLESLLRQDPAKILFGEIRDREIAEIALRTSLTGRVVVTTQRAADAAAAIADLLRAGCDPALLEGSLTAVLAQRLIRLLCPVCRKPCPPQDEQLRHLGIPRERVSMMYEPQGCEHCLGGFRGCTAVFELVVVDQRLRSAFGSQPTAETLRSLAAAGGSRSLWHAAIARVLAGDTSMVEARRVVS